MSVGVAIKISFAISFLPLFIFLNKRLSNSNIFAISAITPFFTGYVTFILAGAFSYISNASLPTAITLFLSATAITFFSSKLTPIPLW